MMLAKENIMRELSQRYTLSVSVRPAVNINHSRIGLQPTNVTFRTCFLNIRTPVASRPLRNTMWSFNGIVAGYLPKLNGRQIVFSDSSSKGQ